MQFVATSATGVPLGLPGWAWLALNLCAGACIPLALAPFDYWPLALLGIAVLHTSLIDRPGGHFAQAFAFGLGLFGVGASWVFVSISQFGSSSVPLSLLLTAIFVAGLALVFALPYTLFKRFRAASPLLTLVLTAPTFWLLGEWLRSWLLTGFPWLYIGYSQLDTWLAGFAPVGGVLLVGLALSCTASALAAALLASRQRNWLAAVGSLALIGFIWLTGNGYQQQRWTQASSDDVMQVGLVQPNIPQDQKWLAQQVRPTLDLLAKMSAPLWSEADWVLWPEAALPTLHEYALPYLDQIESVAQANQSALITGVLYRRPGTGDIFNSIVVRGNGQGTYLKTRLVPFGEYVPLEKWLRGTLKFFDLPTSIIARGEGQQGALQVGDHLISANICYEVVYPTLIARNAVGSDLLLTISNDAWFGNSIGPLQHMQMAQMRALETQRYLVRGTNNGVSAIVDHRGDITAQLPQFTRQTLLAAVQARRGATPFMRLGDTLVLSFLLLALPLLWLANRRHQSS